MDGVGGLHHQPFPPARGRRPDIGTGANGGLEGSARSAADHALGRSCGGLTSEVHLACDGRALHVAVVLTPGNVNNCTVFKAVLESVRVPRTGAGRPRQRLDTVIANKAHSSREVRQGLRRRARTAGRPGRATGGLRAQHRTAAGHSGRGVGARAGPASGRSSFSLLLFLEHVPQMLAEWLGDSRDAARSEPGSESPYRDHGGDPRPDRAAPTAARRRAIMELRQKRAGRAGGRGRARLSVSAGNMAA